MIRLFSAVLLLATAQAAPLRILAIGDSLSEEYNFEVTFSAPQSDPYNANVRNWPELIGKFRAGDATLGSYKNSPLAYSDVRDGGYKSNFGVPGYTTSSWIDILHQSSYNPFTDNAQEFLWYRSRTALIDQLKAVDCVVVFLGGNDIREEYGGIVRDELPQSFYDGILNRIGEIHSFVRSRHASLPIILCTIPDVGATPKLGASYGVSQTAAARPRIAALNQSLIDFAAAKSRTRVARIDRLTDRIFDQHPFHLNGTIITVEGLPENPPDHLFCRDDFHPSTVGQALIANEIFTAINKLAGTSIPLFSDREILRDILLLNPDQPYLDWLATEHPAATGMADDPDGDGIPNLVEMALATDPREFSAPFSGTWRPGSSLTWSPDSIAARYIELIAQESTDLVTWKPVPAARLAGSSASPEPAVPQSFLRLKAEAR